VGNWLEPVRAKHHPVLSRCFDQARGEKSQTDGRIADRNQSFAQTAFSWGSRRKPEPGPGKLAHSMACSSGGNDGDGSSQLPKSPAG
jgi:hypothetical protein